MYVDQWQRTNAWTNKWTHEWTNAHTNEHTNEWAQMIRNEHTNTWTNKCTHERMNSERTHEQMNDCKPSATAAAGGGSRCRIVFFFLVLFYSTNIFYTKLCVRWTVCRTTMKERNQQHCSTGRGGSTRTQYVFSFPYLLNCIYFGLFFCIKLLFKRWLYTTVQAPAWAWAEPEPSTRARLKG